MADEDEDLSHLHNPNPDPAVDDDPEEETLDYGAAFAKIAYASLIPISLRRMRFSILAVVLMRF
jgi:hypothetical protein